MKVIPWDTGPAGSEQFAAGTPIQYTANYPEWGSWSVSAAAHERYGLIPLAPVTDGYAPPEGERPEPLTRVLLLSPGELGAPIGVGSTAVKSMVRNGIIDVRITLGSTQQDVVRQQLGRITSSFRELQDEGLHAVSDSELQAQIYSSENVPLVESVGQDAPQLLIGYCANTLDRILPRILFSEKVAAGYRDTYKVFWRGGLITSGGGAIAAEGLITNNYAAALGGLVLSGLFLGQMFRLGKRAVTAHTQALSEQERATYMLGKSIALDIYSLYSREGFSQRLSGPEDTP